MHRVAILFEFNTLNGGEYSLLASLDRLPTQEFEIIACLPAGGRLNDELEKRDIEQVPLQLVDASNRRMPREVATEAMKQMLLRLRPDLVHANSLSMGRRTGCFAEQLQCPCLAYLRDIIKLTRGAIADLACNQALVAVSAATERFHLQQGLPSDRLRVIHNGVDCQRFRPANRLHHASARKQLGLPDGCFLIGTIGQIGLRKGQNVLADAAAINRDTLPDAHYLLVGERLSSKRESVEFEQAIEQSFRSAGMLERLHRLGFRDDISELMSHFDLLVHPAHQEPLGRVLLEAGAAGLPTIATDVGGTSEIHLDQQTAYLVPPNQPQQLAEAIAKLYRQPLERQRLAAAARERICNRFDAEQAALNLFALWRELIATSIG